jgi:hypothetical protein
VERIGLLSPIEIVIGQQKPTFAVSEAPPLRLSRHDLLVAGAPDTALRLMRSYQACVDPFLSELRHSLTLLRC